MKMRSGQVQIAVSVSPQCVTVATRTLLVISLLSHVRMMFIHIRKALCMILNWNGFLWLRVPVAESVSPKSIVFLIASEQQKVGNTVKFGIEQKVIDY